MKSFTKQFEYELWANTLTHDALATVGAQPEGQEERSLFLFSHILNAHAMWLDRVHGDAPKVGLFDVHTLAECAAMMHTNTERWKAYLATMPAGDLERVITFTFPLDGSTQRISVEDALTHLISHSSYHRGQIIARLKGRIEPLPLTTYIAYAMKAG